MPFAQVYVPEGVLTPEQRSEIVRGIHEVILTAEGRPFDSPTYVLISELPAAGWGFTGRIPGRTPNPGTRSAP